MTRNRDKHPRQQVHARGKPTELHQQRDRQGTYQAPDMGVPQRFANYEQLDAHFLQQFVLKWRRLSPRAKTVTGLLFLVGLGLTITLAWQFLPAFLARLQAIANHQASTPVTDKMQPLSTKTNPGRHQPLSQQKSSTPPIKEVRKLAVPCQDFERVRGGDQLKAKVVFLGERHSQDSSTRACLKQLIESRQPGTKVTVLAESIPRQVRIPCQEVGLPELENLVTCEGWDDQKALQQSRQGLLLAAQERYIRVLLQEYKKKSDPSAFDKIVNQRLLEGIDSLHELERQYPDIKRTDEDYNQRTFTAIEDKYLIKKFLLAALDDIIQLRNKGFSYPKILNNLVLSLQEKMTELGQRQFSGITPGKIAESKYEPETAQTARKLQARQGSLIATISEKLAEVGNNVFFVVAGRHHVFFRSLFPPPDGSLAAIISETVDELYEACPATICTTLIHN